MTADTPAYGFWVLVVLNSAIFLMFAFSFFKPNTARDWRTFGAFIVALFVEMYGFPLSICLMSGWLQTKYPNLDLMSHNTGHLWSTLLGKRGDPHFGPLHIASYVFLGLGFYLLSSAWNVLYHAQRHDALATLGAYARIRYRQYVAFVLILLGFLLQWPTLPTLLMFPVLLLMYARLARSTKRPRCASASVPNSKPMQHAAPAFCRHGNMQVQWPEQTASTSFSILKSREQTACKHSASMSAA